MRKQAGALNWLLKGETSIFEAALVTCFGSVPS